MTGNRTRRGRPYRTIAIHCGSVTAALEWLCEALYRSPANLVEYLILQEYQRLTGSHSPGAQEAAAADPDGQAE